MILMIAPIIVLSAIASRFIICNGSVFAFPVCFIVILHTRTTF